MKTELNKTNAAAQEEMQKTAQEAAYLVRPSFYSAVVKRFFDIVLSALALLLLSWLYLILFIAIKIDDPGPALFYQKRVGKKKNGELTYFKLAKFRSMRMSTPHDMPTHMLDNPDQYITKIGHFLRKASLDELPQIAHIFTGKMSIIGPRPALWNQYDLIAERDKYGANDITPGLTGLAQVNGRDELEIDDKARFDGEYAAQVTFKTDWKCFWMTVANVLKSEGVVEGGTGELKKSPVAEAEAKGADEAKSAASEAAYSAEAQESVGAHEAETERVAEDEAEKAAVR